MAQPLFKDISIVNFNIEKLIGREKYSTWVFAVKNLLHHEELWDRVERIYPAKLDNKDKSKIILLIDKINYVHIEDVNASHEVWNNLKALFEDSGLTWKVELLRQLITSCYSTSDNIEDYVSRIVSTAHKLKEVDMPVSDELIGTLLLPGLPDDYMRFN